MYRKQYGNRIGRGNGDGGGVKKSGGGKNGIYLNSISPMYKLNYSESVIR
jgi:hypothetical protein